MHFRRLQTVVLSILVLIIGMFSFPHQAKAERSYRITEYLVDVQIQKDGSAVFTEKLTYDFRGAYNGVEFAFDYDGVGQPKDISVAMKSPSATNPFTFALSDTENPGTYSLVDQDKLLQFRVYNPMADEIQQVIYSFTVPEIVENYDDVAQFNWKLIGSNVNVPIDKVHIAIHLPEKVDNEQLRAWGHGPKQGLVSLEGNQTAVLTATGVDANQFVEARVIFPPSVTSANPNKSDQKMLQTILDEEAELASQLEREQMIWRLLGIGMALIAPIGSVFLIYASRKAKQKANPTPTHIPEHYFELPEEIPPATVQYAVFKDPIGTEEVTATILDLVRRGVLTITEETTNQKRFLGKESEKTFRIARTTRGQNMTLLPYEDYLLRWFIDRIGDGQSVTFKAIENYPKASHRNADNFSASYQNWSSRVTSMAAQYNVYSDSHSKYSTLHYVTIMGNFIVLVILTFFLMMGYLDWAWLLLPLIGAIALIISRVVNFPILTAKGDVSRKKWAGFKKMLQDIGNFKVREVASIVVWEQLLVYATAFGLADKVIKALQVEFSSMELQSTRVTDVYYRYPVIISHGLNNSLDRGLSNASANRTPPKSNSSGFGGGFSGGSSGGGGGGGGAGAF